MHQELLAIRDFYSVGERLGTAGQPTESQFHAIKKAGFDAVVNLALPTSDHALPNESALVTALGIIYAQIPVDFKNPTDADFSAFCGIMDALEGRRVFVHCAANKRVSAFIFVYRVLRQQVEISEAERDLRAVWQPDHIWSRFIQDQLSRRALDARLA